jgi:hypothetical protein
VTSGDAHLLGTAGQGVAGGGHGRRAEEELHGRILIAEAVLAMTVG